MRASEAHDDAGVLPIFPLDYVLPGQLMALNVFEPRYRLMVCRGMWTRATMDQSRRLALQTLGTSGIC